ncbi:MAG: TIGR01777 family oxidoreductase [Bacteroidales bacterium]|nr:TIGR01777 family oxidoreductase [Bacteroidales bacterium]
MKNILIAGGTGLIGTALCGLLTKKGYSVAVLSRSKKNLEYPVFQWDPLKGDFDDKALDFADGIIFLSGENVGAKRWTNRQKQIIVESRVQSIELLIEKIKQSNKKPEFFISASATGYYGGTLTDRISLENDVPGHDFLAKTTFNWESSLLTLKSLDIRLVTLRTGVVLSPDEGALPKMMLPVKLGVGSALGSGKQYIPWIALADIVQMYLYAIENPELNSVYNAVAPNPVPNKQFMRLLAKYLDRPFFFPPVPSFLLKLLLGEMSEMVLKGNRVSSEKIQKAGFKFQYKTLEEYFKTLK